MDILDKGRDKGNKENGPSELDPNFALISNFVNERDLKLWKGQYTAKYGKMVYDHFRKENERMDSELANIERKIKKYEEKLPKFQLLNEQTMNSITIASAVEKQLIKRKIDIENNKAMWKEKYENLISTYTKVYEDKKRLLADDNPLYKELENLKLEVQKLQIEEKILDQSIIDKKRILQKKKDIHCQIVNTNIVSFVKSYIDAQKLKEIDREIAEKKIIMQDLLQQYENQTKYKGQAEQQKPAKNTTIPKLQGPEIFQCNATNNELINFPTKAKRILTNIPKIDDASIISQLKKRTNERKRILQKQNSSVILSITTNPVSKQPSFEVKLKENIVPKKSDSGQKVPGEEHYEPSPKIKIIQDEVINTGLLKNNLGQIESFRKHGSSTKYTGKETKNDNKKKNKRVTFDMEFSQEKTDGTPKISNVKNAEDITDSQFTNIPKSLTEEWSFFSQANDNTTIEEMSFLNSKDMTRDTSLSPQPLNQSADRIISDEDPDDTATGGLFPWIDSSQQTATGFGSNFGSFF